MNWKFLCTFECVKSHSLILGVPPKWWQWSYLEFCCSSGDPPFTYLGVIPKWRDLLYSLRPPIDPCFDLTPNSIPLAFWCFLVFPFDFCVRKCCGSSRTFPIRFCIQSRTLDSCFFHFQIWSFIIWYSELRFWLKFAYLKLGISALVRDCRFGPVYLGA